MTLSSTLVVDSLFNAWRYIFNHETTCHRLVLTCFQFDTPKYTKIDTYVHIFVLGSVYFVRVYVCASMRTHGLNKNIYFLIPSSKTTKHKTSLRPYFSEYALHSQSIVILLSTAINSFIVCMSACNDRQSGWKLVIENEFVELNKFVNSYRIVCWECMWRKVFRNCYIRWTC